MIDEDGLPMPPRPWEPHGSPPRRQWTWGKPMVLVGVIVVVAFVAVAILFLVPSKWGFG